MQLCLVEPDTTVTIPNKAWISSLFNLKIIPLSEDLAKNVFPLYIVHGAVSIDHKYKSIEFEYFRNLSAIGKHFAFVHVMDENYDHNLCAYELDGCRVIFREYVRPKGGNLEFLASYIRSFRYLHAQSEKSLSIITNLRQLKYRLTYGRKVLSRQYFPRLPDKVIRNIPLGYTDMIAEFIGADVPQIDKRQYIWNFCGDIYKSDRQKMIASLSEIEPQYCHTYKGFMGADKLSGREYWEVLSNSIYSPCPIGNFNIDSYRLFESLEAGSIPLVSYNHAEQPYDYYHELLGDHPIPTFSRWEEARDFILGTTKNETISLSHRITKWYEAYKRDLQASIRDILADIVD